MAKSTIKPTSRVFTVGEVHMLLELQREFPGEISVTIVDKSNTKDTTLSVDMSNPEILGFVNYKLDELANKIKLVEKSLQV